MAQNVDIYPATVSVWELFPEVQDDVPKHTV